MERLIKSMHQRIVLKIINVQIKGEKIKKKLLAPEEMQRLKEKNIYFEIYDSIQEFEEKNSKSISDFVMCSPHQVDEVIDSKK